MSVSTGGLHSVQVWLGHPHDWLRRHDTQQWERGAGWLRHGHQQPRGHRWPVPPGERLLHQHQLQLPADRADTVHRGGRARRGVGPAAVVRSVWLNSVFCFLWNSRTEEPFMRDPWKRDSVSFKRLIILFYFIELFEAFSFMFLCKGNLEQVPSFFET